MPDDALAIAVRNLEEENFSVAIPALTALAEAGNVEAMYRLGVAGLFDVDEIAHAKAFGWLKKAADQDHPDACRRIASFIGHNDFASPLTPGERLAFLQKAVALRNADAQYQLAESFCTGDWLDGRETIDQAKAFELYKKASDQGHAEAQYELGWAYLKGEGTPVDKAAAEVLFTKSAAQGNSGARRVLDDLMSGKLAVD